MIPRATYRLQLHKGFGFEAMTDCVPYLAALGVSHAYLSPYLKARPGSGHGYDIVDHAQINPELGDEAAFRRMSETLKSYQLGQILDFVPNHMGVGGSDNPLWLNVLEWGPDATHAGWFDIEWDPQRRYLHNKVLVPFLGDHYGIELERGALQLKYDDADGSFAVWAYDTHKLPITPPHYAEILGSEHPALERLADAFAWLPNWRLQMGRRASEFKTQLAQLVDEHDDVRAALNRSLARFQGRADEPRGWQELDALIQKQYWRIAYFRVAADDINYRRFFNINDLAGLRIELPEVFDHAHQRVLRLVKDGVIDGLRIDHIDGLLDPKGYLSRLRRRLAARHTGGHFYLVAEKILAAHETLREDWPVDGTTGYDFLNQVLLLLVDTAAEAAFTECYAQFTGERRTFGEIGRLCKLHIMDHEMSGELNVLARDLARLARQNPRTADFTQSLLRRAVKEIIACFPVYRTYIDGSGVLEGADERDLGWALAQARRNEYEIDPSAFSFLEQVLSAQLTQRPHSGFSRQSLLRCAMRLQQYSGPVAAKGLEDTAFYRYNRLIALNEVGGDPGRFGGTLAGFHRANQQRAQRWRHSMLATATHDTKRGEDARARLAALSEFPEEWARLVNVWARILRGPTATPEPDRNDEYALYQVLLGSWPCELLDERECHGELMNAFSQRVQQTMLKSIREARVHTSWAFPNAHYEEAMTALIDTGLTGSRASAFIAAFLPFARQVARCGVHNSLIQTAIKLTAPGVPDLYTGSELWDLSMVDPDNRRAVDYPLRVTLLRQMEQALSADGSTLFSQLLDQWGDGRIKLAVIACLLRHRNEQPDLYTHGDYQPLSASGPRAEEFGAYVRVHGERRLIVAFARYARRRESEGFDESTHVPIPESLRHGPWREILSGREVSVDSDRLDPRVLFSQLPVAVLVAT
ncbi:MAG TPA: malto-oligosyltrehalose synthase [Steroidobacteraceae bacterium]|jgi:(1->4)-alpha-D-glucan 1-alpha-D-glucosylmutase